MCLLLSQNVAKMMADMQNPDFQKILEESLRSVTGGAAVPGGPVPDAAAVGGDGAHDPTLEDPSVAATMQMLAKMSMEQGADPDSTQAMGEEVMKKLMDEFTSMGHKEDFQGVIDNMMKQLLAKDVMYLPMKQICEKFPVWLAENESKLPREEYEKYGKQYQQFQRMVAVYETEPDNFPRLMELMQDVRGCGARVRLARAAWCSRLLLCCLLLCCLLLCCLRVRVCVGGGVATFRCKRRGSRPPKSSKTWRRGWSLGRTACPCCQTWVQWEAGRQGCPRCPPGAQ